MIKDPQVIGELMKLFKEASEGFSEEEIQEAKQALAKGGKIMEVDLGFIEDVINSFGAESDNEICDDCEEYHVSTEQEDGYHENEYLDEADPSYSQTEHLARALGQVVLNTLEAPETLSRDTVDKLALLVDMRCKVIKHAN